MVTLKVYIGLLVLGSVLTLPVNVHSEQAPVAKIHPFVP